MSGSSCGSKDALSQKETEKSVDRNAELSRQVAVLKKEMREQIKEMKELSTITVLAIDKISKMKVEGIPARLDHIDARLSSLEGRVAAIDSKANSPGMALKKDRLTSECVSARQGTTQLPKMPAKLLAPPGPKEAESHIIETTMSATEARKEKDQIIKTTGQPEKENDSYPAKGRENIFTKFMGNILPAQKKEPVSAQCSAAPHRLPEIRPPDEAQIIKNKQEAHIQPPETKAAPKVTEEIVASPPKKPVTDLLAVDKKDLRHKMEELISSASRMVCEKRYSEATEEYLKLIDAYEKNKDDPQVEELGTKLDELYDKISSNLLNNLMDNDSSKKTSIFDQNNSF